MGHAARLVNIVDKTEKLAALERLTSATNTMEAVLHQSPVAIFATDSIERVTRTTLERDAAIAHQVISDIIANEPDRIIDFQIEPVMRAYGDPWLLRLLMENLLENAIKFTALKPDAMISITSEGHAIYIVRDNGAGFDMRYAHKLFQPFERLHTSSEFDGHGFGLATCQRVVARHCGQITLVGSPDAGAIALFTLQPGPEIDD